MNHWEYWITIIGLIAAVLVLNHFLQRALATYDNMIVTPVYFTSVLIVSVLSGIFFFGYFADITTGAAIAFGVGLFAIAIGCILLTVKHASRGADISDLVQPAPDFLIFDSSQTVAADVIEITGAGVAREPE